MYSRSSHLVRENFPQMFEEAALDATLGGLAGRLTGFTNGTQAKRPRRVVHSARVLIVDDDPANRILLEEILRAHGFSHIETIADARQVLPMFMTYQPD